MMKKHYLYILYCNNQQITERKVVEGERSRAREANTDKSPEVINLYTSS